MDSFLACCSCEVAKEVQERQNAAKSGTSPSTGQPGKSGKPIGLLAHKKCSGESLGEHASEGDANGEAAGSFAPAPRGVSSTSQAPLPPPAGAPPEDGEQAPPEAAGGRASRADFGKKGRRGSHLVQRKGSEVDVAPPEETPEFDELAPMARMISTGPVSLDEIFAELATLDGLLKTTYEVAFFGITSPGKHALATMEKEFTEKTLLSALSPPDLAARRTLMATRDGIAVLCWKGRKPEQPNQDNFFFCQTSRFRICCVADGHGEFGHWVSHWTVRIVMARLTLYLDQAE